VFVLIKIPLDKIVERIKAEKGVSEAEINSRIDKKLAQLSGLISREGAAHIVANEFGVKLFDNVQGRMKVENILSGMRSVEVVGKVQKVFEVREFDKGERKGKVANIVIGDETGAIRVVFWNEHADLVPNLKEGDIIKIVGSYVKENLGRNELHLNSYSKVFLNPPGESVGAVKQFSVKRKNVKDLVEGDENVEILGTVVQVFDLRFFEVCPECNKRIRLGGDNTFMCDQHGGVVPKYSYVLNFFVDDGTENVRAVCFKNQADRLLRISAQDINVLRNDSEKVQALKDGLLGNIVKLIGKVNKNQLFGRVEFLANMVFVNPDPDEEVKRLNEEITELEK